MQLEVVYQISISSQLDKFTSKESLYIKDLGKKEVLYLPDTTHLILGPSHVQKEQEHCHQISHPSLRCPPNNPAHTTKQSHPNPLKFQLMHKSLRNTYLQVKSRLQPRINPWSRRCACPSLMRYIVCISWNGRLIVPLATSNARVGT